MMHSLVEHPSINQPHKNLTSWNHQLQTGRTTTFHLTYYASMKSFGTHHTSPCAF